MRRPLDAGELREELARELADWQAAGFVPSHQAQRFDRRLHRLARMTGLTRDEVHRELETDAEAIAWEHEGDGPLHE